MVESYLNNGFNPGIYGIGLPKDAMNDLGGLEKELKMGIKNFGKFLVTLGLGGIMLLTGGLKDKQTQYETSIRNPQGIEQTIGKDQNVFDRFGFGVNSAYAGGDKWQEPLYGILDEGVDIHTPDEHDRKVLHMVFNKFNSGKPLDYREIAWALIEDYDTNNKEITSQIPKMKNFGGNNPIYWAALRLINEAIGTPTSYDYTIDDKRIELPTSPTMMTYINNMRYKGGYKIYSENGKNRFSEYILNSNILAMKNTQFYSSLK